jgi:hypothetical protein
MKVLRWVGIVAALALLVGVVVYGYKTKPVWVGVSDKKFWDYLESLIVPAALAIGVAWLVVSGSRATLPLQRSSPNVHLTSKFSFP